MKFLFLGPGYPETPGVPSGSGIGTYLREITLGLTAAGHQCHVLSWGPDRRTVETPEGVVVHVHPKGYWPIIEKRFPESRNLFERRRETQRLDRKHRFDWIEIEHDEGIDRSAAAYAGERGTLRIYTTLIQHIEAKSETPTTSRLRGLALERRALLESSHVLAPSQLHARELSRLFPTMKPAESLRLGLDYPAPQSAAPPNSSMPKILVIGTPDIRKGFDRLRPIIDAFQSRHGPAHWVIVSTRDPNRLRPFNLIDTNGVSSSIIEAIGDLTSQELQARYEESSVLFHPARYESFGYPLVEAAAYGRPVVSTRVGTAPELLEGDLERFLVNGDDPNECADTLATAIRQGSELGAELRSRYLKSYTRSAMTEAMLTWLATRRG